MGTPSFAVPSLISIINSDNKVIACITQPDKKRGRGKEISYCSIKKTAIENDILVLQPDSINKQIWVDEIKKLEPDLFITCAYGQILSKRILDIPKYGCINIHASLLPQYRGAAPINKAILNGDSITGITTMMTDIGMDTGDILLKEEIDIPIDMTFLQLHDQLSILGSKVILTTLEGIKNKKLLPVKQDNSKATYARMLQKKDGIIDFNESSLKIYNKIRAFNPWPSCYTSYNKKKLKIVKATFDNIDYKVVPGTIISSTKEKIVIACKKGTLNIIELQFENKKMMHVSSCYHNIKEDTILGE